MPNSQVVEITWPDDVHPSGERYLSRFEFGGTIQRLMRQAEEAFALGATRVEVITSDAPRYERAVSL
jgi:hypothetical protein